MPALANGLGLSRTRFNGGGVSYTPPLDAVTAKCIAAWGLARLFTGVTEATRVRESGGSTEQDVGTLVTGEFDAASFATFIGVNNGFATTAYDHKGANDAINTTAAQQPQILASSGIGSKAAMVFTGAEFLSTAGNVTGTNWGTGDFEVWYVCRPTTLSGGDIALGARGSYSPELYTRAGSVNKPAVWAGAYRRFDTTLLVDTNYLLRFYWHGGILYCDVNGVQEATSHAVSLATSVEARLTLGADSPSGNDKAKSQIAFNAWFNAALTAGEASALTAALKTFYGIA